MSPNDLTASLTAMTAVAYRELERVLEQALKGFSATRQKLNPYERGVRDRIAKIFHEVARLRNRRVASDLTVTRDA